MGDSLEFWLLSITLGVKNSRYINIMETVSNIYQFKKENEVFEFFAIRN
jgi:hypothetical protein